MSTREDVAALVDALKEATTEKAVKRTHIVEDLRNTNSEKAVEQVFEKADIVSLDEKIAMLKEAKGGEKVTNFYTPNFEALTLDEKYTFELKVFLTGAWKKTQQYKDLMGY